MWPNSCFREAIDPCLKTGSDQLAAVFGVIITTHSIRFNSTQLDPNLIWTSKLTETERISVFSQSGEGWYRPTSYNHSADPTRLNSAQLNSTGQLSWVEPISRLRFDYDTTTIRRCHDAFDYDGSDRNYDLRSIRLRYDYDMTTTKNWHVHFLLASNRVEWKQARAIRRSRIVVVS